jgi:hypothetical protein
MELLKFSSNVNECKESLPAMHIVRPADCAAPAIAAFDASAAAAAAQGLTLGPVSGQLELFCPPCNPT